jgi:hypothetical protein
MAGIEIDEDFLRDAVVDVAAGRGVGVNGINVNACGIHGDRIALRLSSPFPWRRQPVVVFHRADPERLHRLLVNDKDAGTWSGADLARGVLLSPLPTR